MRVIRSDPTAPVPEFIVYLRAFETTGRLNVPLYSRLPSFIFAGFTASDLESHLAAALRRHTPLIALGRPGEAYGAARVPTSDEEWKEDILLLLQRSKAILLIPSHQPGTIWEIALIRREGLLQKSVFIMPPQSKKIIHTGRRWQEAKVALRELDLELPDYQRRGMLFAFENTGRVTNVEPLLVGGGRKFQKSLDRLVSGKLPEGGLFQAVVQADRRSRRLWVIGWFGAVYFLAPFVLVGWNFLLPELPRPPVKNRGLSPWNERLHTAI